MGTRKNRTISEVVYFDELGFIVKSVQETQVLLALGYKGFSNVLVI